MRLQCTKEEFDELTLEEIGLLLHALNEEETRQRHDRANLLCAILNAPHFSKKDKKPYEPADLIPLTDDEREQRREQKLQAQLESFKNLLKPKKIRC